MEINNQLIYWLTNKSIDYVLLISFNDFDSILFIRYRFTKLYTNQNFVLLIFLSLSEGELEHNRFFFTIQQINYHACVFYKAIIQTALDFRQMNRHAQTQKCPRRNND